MPLSSTRLEDQFSSLLQREMTSLDQTKIDAKLYDQVWSSADLNPDRITSEMSKLFTYNEAETNKHRNSDNYFNFNQAYAKSSNHLGQAGLDIVDLFSVGGGGATSDSTSNSSSTTNHSMYSLTDIQNILNQNSIEVEWTGEKFLPKSFSVYRLTDIISRLQVAFTERQLTVDRKRGAFLRTINIKNTSLSASQLYSWSFVGEIKLYSGKAEFLPPNWVVCHGQALSRIEYQSLFSVIGESFGSGDGKTTFNVPDLRGRFVMGRDPSQIRIDNATKMGDTGGHSRHTLTNNELPTHYHGSGS
ncbi:unnamed protein product, partial [Rotaria sp. Silwood2]